VGKSKSLARERWIESPDSRSIVLDGVDAGLREADELESFRRSMGKARTDAPIALNPPGDRGTAFNRNRRVDPTSGSFGREFVRLFFMFVAGIAATAASTLVAGAGVLSAFFVGLCVASVVGVLDWYVCTYRAPKVVHEYAKRFTFAFTPTSFTLSAPRTVEQGFLLEEIASFEAHHERLVLILADGTRYPLACSPHDVADLALLADRLAAMLLHAKTEGAGYRGRVRLATDATNIPRATDDEVPDDDSRVGVSVKQK